MSFGQSHFFFLVAGRDVFPGPQMLPVRTQTQQLWQSCGELHREAGRPEAWERGLDGGGGWEYLIATVLALRHPQG